NNLGDAFPEYAIRSANAICKRLVVGGASVSIDSPNCNLDLASPPPPSVCDPCQDTGCPGSCDTGGGGGGGSCNPCDTTCNPTPPASCAGVPFLTVQLSVADLWSQQPQCNKSS